MTHNPNVTINNFIDNDAAGALAGDDSSFDAAIETRIAANKTECPAGLACGLRAAVFAATGGYLLQEACDQCQFPKWPATVASDINLEAAYREIHPGEIENERENLFHVVEGKYGTPDYHVMTWEGLHALMPGHAGLVTKVLGALKKRGEYGVPGPNKASWTYTNPYSNAVFLDGALAETLGSRRTQAPLVWAELIGPMLADQQYIDSVDGINTAGYRLLRRLQQQLITAGLYKPGDQNTAILF